MSEKGIIKLLPDAIANQIAAGEVIQRPASVVKELLENAIDANASNISLIAKDAGRTLIQVIDNGKGMSTTDARMCFERHATSKIKKIDDLFSLFTMGFRGEAMASIAAVAQVEMKTKMADESLGTKITIEGSKIIEHEPCSHTDGTSITVRNLFFNVPARRNFLKSNQVETKHIIDEFIHIALAHPDIGFVLVHNNIELYNLKGGNLRQRIVSLFGKNYNEMMVPVCETTDYIKVDGFIGKPEVAKKTRGEQFFFVNKRFIKSVFLNNAIAKAYEGLIADKSYPFYCLFIDINPANIDINVHPTKQEIKFDDERSVYMILNAAGKRGLAQYSVTPTIDFDQEASFSEMRSFQQPNASQENKSGYTGGHGIDRSTHDQKYEKEWQSMFRFEHEENDKILTIQSKMDLPEFMNQDIIESRFDKDHEKIEPVQLQQKYIVTQIKSGIVIVHQQKAHERILFENYLAQINNQKSSIQKKLFPKTIALTPADSEILDLILPEIEKLGFEIENFGTNTYVIHALPADIEEENIETIIYTLIEQEKMSENIDLNAFRTKICYTLAKKKAIPVGQSLNNKMMINILDSLFACEQPSVSLEGRATFITLNYDEIDKNFM
jgi:DNA mismatch repair protein MutL